MLDENRNVFETLAERRDLKGDHIQTIEKVVTKVSVLDQILESLVSSPRSHAHPL
jgi:hypothetical protein